VPFLDADIEIEKAAGMTIPEIFSARGEAYFRAGEARVIARLLDSGPQVLATGGGAFMDPATRAAIRQKGISVWLDAELDVLLRRVRRRTDRPLLQSAEPGETLRRLMEERSPIYAEADLIVESRDVPHEAIVEEVLSVVGRRLGLLDAAAAGETE
jgi:shikimate kinase